MTHRANAKGGARGNRRHKSAYCVLDRNKNKEEMPLRREEPQLEKAKFEATKEETVTMDVMKIMLGEQQSRPYRS